MIKAKDEYCPFCHQMHPRFINGCPRPAPPKYKDEEPKKDATQQLSEKIKSLIPHNPDSPAHEYYRRGFMRADAMGFAKWTHTPDCQYYLELYEQHWYHLTTNEKITHEQLYLIYLNNQPTQ